MPRAERRKAFFSALSAKAARDGIVVLEDWQMAAPKTKEVTALLGKLPVTEKQKVLHVHPTYDESLFYSTRNLPGMTSKTVQNMNVIDVMNHDVLLVTKETLKAMETHFTPENV